MNSRVIILVVLIIAIVGVVAAVLVMNGGGTTEPTPVPGETDRNRPVTEVAEEDLIPTDIPTETPEPLKVVIAVQTIRRGSLIGPSDVELRDWPNNIPLFNNAIVYDDPSTEGVDERLSAVIGKLARTDIYVEQPILSSMVVEDLASLASAGSDVAAMIPKGNVAIAIPIDRLTSVAFALQPGDHVDVIVSMLYIEIDEDFQSQLPNNVQLAAVTVPTDQQQGGVTSITFGAAIDGRFESERFLLPAGSIQIPVDMPVLVSPAEAPRPRLVTQRTVTDALVLHIGNFPLDGVLFPTPTPKGASASADEAAIAEEAEAANTVPPTRPPANNNQAVAATATVEPTPDIVTLAVSPQQAVALTYMMESRMPITFVLRAAGDLSQSPTNQVTLRYIMENYGITVPTKEEFAIEPAIRSIRSLYLSSTVDLGTASDALNNAAPAN